MNKTMILTLSAMGLSVMANAATLKQRDASVYNYDVLFTNPTCAKHTYAKPVETQSGRIIKTTPENVYCTSGDRKVTARRDGSDTRMGYTESPQHRLLSLINADSTKSIFMTYLSFSDSTIARALCSKMANTGMKLELILDKKNESGSIDRSLKRLLKPGEKLSGATRKRVTAQYEDMKAKAMARVIKYAKIENRTDSQEKKYKDAKKSFEKLLTKSQYLESILCSSDGMSNDQDYKVKRMKKQKGINWSHTKVFMVNPADKKKITLSFASANMSSGTTIHHENWHFVTASTNSHFMQSHICLKDAEFNHADSRKEFIKYMKSCRDEIAMDEESDIKTFFVPGDGDEAIKLFSGAIKWSTKIDLAGHRFTLKPLMSALRSAKKKRAKIRMVFDDDMYLAGERRLAEGVRVPNMPHEYNNVLSVIGKSTNTVRKNGAEARYMQTNHYAHTIHHNKYMIFNNSRRGGRSLGKKPDQYKKAAVFCGAGNFTKAAFMTTSSATNLENYYYITIPEVVEAFRDQYDYKWNNLATKYEDLPLEDVKAK
jgi:hypothetical protein